MKEIPFTIVKKVIHGQEVEVKVYPAGVSSYIDEDDLEIRVEEPTVKPTGVEFYLIKED